MKMESQNVTEGWQPSITHASETLTKRMQESLTVPEGSAGQTSEIKRMESQDKLGVANPQDQDAEIRLLERAENVLQYCDSGLTKGSSGLETALDQVRRRLRRPSESR